MDINIKLYKCTKHQFIHLLTATCNDLHIENSKNHKKVISVTTTSPNCQFAVVIYGVKGSRQVKKARDMILVVSRWHWLDDRECTEEQFQWNDV